MTAKAFDEMLGAGGHDAKPPSPEIKPGMSLL